MLSAERKIAALASPPQAARPARLARSRQRVYITLGFIVVLRTHIYLYLYIKLCMILALCVIALKRTYVTQNL